MLNLPFIFHFIFKRNPHVTEEAQEENDVKYELRMYERKK